jgi:hypothetical protein
MKIKTRGKSLKFIILCFLAAGAFIFSSCSVKNEISLAADGSGRASLEANIDEALVFYMQSLAELTGEQSKDGKLFNVEEIKKGIEENPGVRVESIKNFDDRKITSTVSFNNIEELILETRENLGRQVISFKEFGAEKEIKIYIDIDNFTDIAPLFPMVEEPLFMTFGPLENQGLTEEEYLEMMEYALGDGGGELIKKSMITTEITIDGNLISQKGGTVSEKNTVVFETPLIRLLLLDKPIEYSIRFR